MQIAALLTGKGSSSLKNKNILKIFSKPVLWYPATEALKVKKINKYFVSSEDKKILNISAKLGYRKILRPKRCWSLQLYSSEFLRPLPLTFLKKSIEDNSEKSVFLKNLPLASTDFKNSSS